MPSSQSRATSKHAEIGTTGRESKHHPLLSDLWKTASDLNVNHGTSPGAAAGGEFVPWRTIVVDDEFSPRLGEVDEETVKRYEACLDELPPIVVQKGTFRLADGKHRFTAFTRHRDHVRIREVEIASEDLLEYAITANITHGLPLKLAHRLNALKQMLKQHGPGTRNMWSTSRLATTCGVDRLTASNYAKAMTDGQAAPEGPVTVIGADGRKQKVHTGPKVKSEPTEPTEAQGEPASASPTPLSAPAKRKPLSIPVGGITSALVAAGGIQESGYGDWILRRSAEQLRWLVENLLSGDQIVIEGSVAAHHLSELVEQVIDEIANAGMI